MQSQSWSEEIIAGWAKRWSFWLAWAALMAGIIVVSRESFNPAALALVLTAVCFALMAAIHCLSREVLNLRRHIDDLEKRFNS